ncbi:uncharacterized protein LOC144449628 [Glandiceps talaboti]
MNFGELIENFGAIRTDTAIFRLDNGSVQLIPTFNQVTKPQLDAILVLDEPIKAGTLTTTCRLISVDSPEQARQTADYPLCEDLDLSRPSAPPAPNITNPSNETTTTPVSTTGQQTTRLTTQDLTTPGFALNASTYWYLPQSTFQFDIDDYYKIVEVKHRTPWYVPVQELVVITCCVPNIESSDNARFINASTGLLMVVDMANDIRINWTLASTPETKDTETFITNPAYLELAPCACDMKTDSCDANCCCDTTDCTEEDLQTFSSCIPGLEGGQEGDPYQYVCKNINVYTPDWHPLLCVEMTSTPYLGMYFDTKLGVKTIVDYDNALLESNDANDYSYADPGRSYGLEDPKYVQGFPVRTRHTEIARNGYLSLPTTNPTSGACTWRSPIQYIIDANSSCIQSPMQSLCTETSFLSARMYVLSSQINHPPCPSFPTVVKDPAQSNSEPVPVHTQYYCTDDVTPFQRSNLTTEELFPRFQTSLFPDNNTDTSRLDVSQVPRCAWDDGYTYPPAPEYDFDTGVCDNAVMSTSYEISWKGSEIVSLIAKFIIGGISLDRDPSIQPTETPLLEEPSDNYTRPFLPPTTAGPFTTLNVTTAEPTTDSPTTERSTLPIGTLEISTSDGGTTEDSTDITSSMAVPTTDASTTVAATTRATTPAAATTITPTEQPSPRENATLTGFPAFTQFFSVYYTYQNPPEVNTETGVIEPAPEPVERSGNPGYIYGRLVLTGEATYQSPSEIIVNNTTPSPLNCTQIGNATLPPGCNETDSQTTNISPTEPVSTFIAVDTSTTRRLKLWKPGAGSLCAESDLMDVYFGEDVASGCLIRLGWSQFQNCTELRNLMEEQLIQLFPADKIGKKGNAESTLEGDWATIFNPLDHEFGEPTPEPTMTTTSVPTIVYETLPPGQIEITPDVPSTLEQIVGTCYDVPTGINVDILIAEVGEYRGAKQREIISAKVSYTTSTLKLNCIGVNGVSCYGNYSDDDEPVQSFVITSTVSFITVPAVQPEPVMSYYANDIDVCRYDTCVEEAFYPMTTRNPNGIYQRNLGYGLFLVLIVIAYYVLTRPWF